MADQQEKYNKLKNEYDQFKLKTNMERKLLSQLREIMYEVNGQLEPRSRQVRNGVVLRYYLSLQIVGRFPQKFSLCLLREERSQASDLDYGCHHQRYRNSFLIVAETQFELDLKQHLLASEWHKTYVAPRSGSFGEKPYETYEQRHFFTLLTHVKMLFAARTRSVFAVGSATSNTCKMLYKYYNDEHTFHRSTSHDQFLDSHGNPLPIKMDGGDNWYHRASGKYAASKACWEIQNKLEDEKRNPTPEEEQIMKQDNAKWVKHINKMITSWMTQAETQKAVRFNAVNQYVLNLF